MTYIFWFFVGASVLFVLDAIFRKPLTEKERTKLFESRFKNKKYIILESKSEISLSDDVNFAISLGYKPVGSISIQRDFAGYDTFYQSMEKA